MLNWKLYQENFKEFIKTMIIVDYEADGDCRGLADSLGVKKTNKKTTAYWWGKQGCREDFGGGQSNGDW